MKDYERRIVVDSGFETVLGEISRAIREEGMQTLARIDVRDHCWRDLGHDFRRYFLIEAWSPDLALEVLRTNLDVGMLLPTTFVLYELADGETAVAAREPLLPMMADAGWWSDNPQLSAFANREIERVARVLDRLQHRACAHAPAAQAAFSETRRGCV